MAIRKINESSLTAIGNAIRAKLGVETTYKPSQMAGAISSIVQAVLETKSITENGTYTPSSGNNGFSSVTVNVPNSYGESDEGKVVSEGQLVSQTSVTKTENGTYDTTLNNEVVVAVPAPTGNINITDMQSTNVSAYATAQIVDSDLVAGNIKKDVDILGIVGTYEGSGGGGSGGALVTPDFQGLSYCYVGNNGNFVQYSTKTNYLSIFPVVSGHTYYLFVGSTVGNRSRIVFFSGKDMDDFEPYLNTAGTNEPIYTGGVLISSGSDTESELVDRYYYTPASDGVIIFFSSGESANAITYCVDMDANGSNVLVGHTPPTSDIGETGQLYVYVSEIDYIVYGIKISVAARGTDYSFAYWGVRDIDFVFTDGSSEYHLRDFTNTGASWSTGNTASFTNQSGVINGNTETYYEHNGLPAWYNIQANVPSGYLLKKVRICGRNDSSWHDFWRTFEIGQMNSYGSKKLLNTLISESNLVFSDWNTSSPSAYTEFELSTPTEPMRNAYKLYLKGANGWVEL